MLTSSSVLIQQQPDIIAARVAHQLSSSKFMEVPMVATTPSSSPDQSLLSSSNITKNNGTQTSLANNVDRTERRRRNRGDRIRRLHFPMKLINIAWEVELFRSRLGWTINLRTINYVPYGSPIFNAIYDGDLEMIKVLFKRKEASINDAFGSSATLLHASFQFPRFT